MRLPAALALSAILAFSASLMCDEKEDAKRPVRIYQLNADGSKTPLDVDKVIIESPFSGKKETVREVLVKLESATTHTIDIILHDANTKNLLSEELGMKHGGGRAIPRMGYDTTLPPLEIVGSRANGFHLTWLGEGALKLQFEAKGYKRKEVTLTKDEANKGSLDVFLTKE
jgi:hypothetical protein